MVILKSHQAMGSFLGRGTHVWLEIHPADGDKITFSGAKAKNLLAIIENLKRDYDKESTRGSVVIPPPNGISSPQWEDSVIQAGRDIKHTMHKKLRYSGAFPFLVGYGNCASIAHLIINQAGGELPKFKFSGFSPGLLSKCS